jgi:tight adherence protein C
MDLYVLMFAIIASAVGFYGPNVYTTMRANARRDEMRRSLPDVLDLMVVCVEAGMGLNTAFKRVAEKIEPAAPTLAREFLKLHREIRAGRSREEALRAMGERTGVEEIRSLAAMMIQTEKLGTSIAKALRVQGESIRTKFHHAAEARAARATVTLAFPLILCIFPALLVVIVGPAALKIWEALGGLA